MTANPSSIAVGASSTVTALSSANLPVSLSTNGACSLSGSTATGLSAGTCTVTASQGGTGDSGTARYQAAANQTVNVTVIAANAAPSASNVTISGTAQVGQTLTGSYTYADAENDPQGTSTYRWLRGAAAIGGATGTTYTPVAADVGSTLQFCVTPVASSGTLTGVEACSTPTAAVTGAPLIELAGFLLNDTGMVYCFDGSTTGASATNCSANPTWARRDIFLDAMRRLERVP